MKIPLNYSQVSPKAMQATSGTVALTFPWDIKTNVQCIKLSPVNLKKAFGQGAEAEWESQTTGRDWISGIDTGTEEEY